MWLTTALSAPTPQFENGQFAFGAQAERSRPKGDCGVASNASVVSHIAFRPLLACRDSDLRSNNTVSWSAESKGIWYNMYSKEK